MKQENPNCDEQNCIEEKARAIFGYDRERLLEEMDEAGRDWEAMKQSDPAEAARVEGSMDAGYQKLMKRVREAEEAEAAAAAAAAKAAMEAAMEASEAQIQPDVESESETQPVEMPTAGRIGDGKKKKRMKRILLMAAVLGVLGVGGSIVATANREYRYRMYPVQEKQYGMRSQNIEKMNGVDKLDRAYAEIQETLGIQVLTLGYIPAGMEFKQLRMDRDRAIIELEQDGKILHVKEWGVSSKNAEANIILSDRKSDDIVHMEWLNRDAQIEENRLSSGQVEYGASINIGNYCYRLEGMIDKDEFIEIVKELSYR
ncbi:MAG: DUF4367 domain-containing protein [Lachnospiraceae bacterium]|nr:DUF4367 domain-containing protein [Lachnospiraceae bacterium]